MKKEFSIHATVAGAALCLLVILWPTQPAQSVTEEYKTSVDVFKRITVLTQEDLHFGNISTRRFQFFRFVNRSGGIVTITPNMFTGTCSVVPSFGNFFDVCDPTTFWQARFFITGTANASYTATLPPFDTANGLTVNTFTGVSDTLGILSSGTTVTGRFNASGVDTLYVGASLLVPCCRFRAMYTSLFTITVNYS